VRGMTGSPGRSAHRPLAVPNTRPLCSMASCGRAARRPQPTLTCGRYQRVVVRLGNHVPQMRVGPGNGPRRDGSSFQFRGVTFTSIKNFSCFEKGSGDLVLDSWTTDRFLHFTAPDETVSPCTWSTTASGRSSGMKWPQPGSTTLLTSLATIDRN
jgi:hypothetical protein